MNHEHVTEWTIFQSDWMRHGECWGWDSSLTWPYTIASGLVALAYMAIPICLLFVWAGLRRGPTVKIPSGLLVWFWSFAVFIFSCGCGHVMDILTTWSWPAYRVQIVITTLTAVSSIGVAIGLAANVGTIVAAVRHLRDRSVRRDDLLREALNDIRRGE